jgi:REP element-mobilizing transposase RayT
MRTGKQLGLELGVGSGWGGKRKGAGRKRVAMRSTPPHRRRPPHNGRWPVHVTWRVREAIPSLRSMRVFPIVRRALAASHKEAFRVVHFSVQSDHVHLIVEGDDSLPLVRGLQGLAVRCAKAINRAVSRRGQVWSSRYHAKQLRTPTQARHGFVYVLLNFCKHLRAPGGVDPRSSAPWFDGWRRAPTPLTEADLLRPDRSVASVEASPVASPRTWLAKIGWRRGGGPISFDERPRSTSAERRSRRLGAARNATELKPAFHRRQRGSG